MICLGAAFAACSQLGQEETLCSIPKLSSLLTRVLDLIEAVISLQSFDITNLTSQRQRPVEETTQQEQQDRKREREREREGMGKRERERLRNRD